MKTALITGANRGLGFEAAAIFLENGWRVVLAGRDTGMLEDARQRLGADETTAPVFVLDMAAPASVASAGERLAERLPTLDVLVNNAGIFPKDGNLTDGLRRALETNVAGPVGLTLALAPLLLRAPSPRVVMVSSGMGSFGLCAGADAPLLEANHLAYQTSKAALNMATVCLDKHFAETPMVITAISPGWCRTDMGGEEAPRTARQGANVIFSAAILPDGSPSGAFLGEEGPLPW